MSDDEVETGRRKLLARSVPYMLNVVWEAHQVLSPSYLASTAIEQYQRLEDIARTNREELSHLTRDVGKLNLQSESMGRLSLTLTRPQMLVLIANYLSTEYFRQASVDAELMPVASLPDFDGMLVLPTKSVFVKLNREDLDQKSLIREIDRAETLNPSDVCIVCYETSHRTDILFDPVFVSENKVQRGRFRLISLPDLFEEISKRKFTATIEKSTESQEEDSVRILFVKSG
ncbi:MAG: hypothetical protein ABSE82_06450 [Nitrososphaerales archaeon]|jgi:hypothetical protein